MPNYEITSRDVVPLYTYNAVSSPIKPVCCSYYDFDDMRERSAWFLKREYGVCLYGVHCPNLPTREGNINARIKGDFRQVWRWDVKHILGLDRVCLTRDFFVCMCALRKGEFYRGSRNRCEIRVDEAFLRKSLSIFCLVYIHIPSSEQTLITRTSLYTQIYKKPFIKSMINRASEIVRRASNFYLYMYTHPQWENIN